MGNSGSSPPHFIKREESFGSKSPKIKRNGKEMVRSDTFFGSTERLPFDLTRHTYSFKKPNRSHSLEQSGNHSPSSSQSSSNNSFINAMSEKDCLRQSTRPKFQISGDLNPHQVNLVKRTWKQVMKSINDDEMEIAIRLLLRIFQIDPRMKIHFNLSNVHDSELRHNVIFVRHVKAFEPTLIHVMSHPGHVMSVSKYLQQLGGRHVTYTGVTYRSAYWKIFVQALMNILGVDQASGDTYEAFMVLGNFCVEQMRIGYKIEYKLQREAERITLMQHKKREAHQENGNFLTVKK